MTIFILKKQSWVSTFSCNCSGANPGGYEGYIYSPIFFAHTPQKIIKFQIWTALESERWRVQIERVNFYLSVYFADSIVLKGAWITHGSLF